MTDTSPAALLRRAANVLRRKAKAAHRASPAPWTMTAEHVVRSADGMIVADRSSTDHPAERADLPYIEAVHPGVGESLADWLDSAAEDAEQIGADPRAVTTALALLGQRAPEPDQTVPHGPHSPSGTPESLASPERAAGGRTAVPPDQIPDETLHAAIRQLARANPPSFRALVARAGWTAGDGPDNPTDSQDNQQDSTDTPPGHDPLTRADTVRTRQDTGLREALDVLLSRAARGALTSAEGPLLRQHVEHLIADRDQLAAVLREVLAEFRFETHPGRRCLQTGHIDVATVERWRSVAADGR